MQTIFTVTVGRSGSDFLAGAINMFARDCIAEHEPPGLLLGRLGERPFFRRRGWLQPNSRLVQIGRNLQRRYLFPDELIGRGKAYDWLENGEVHRLDEIARRKIRRIERFARRGYCHYVEVSQFFIKTQAESLHRLLPDMGIIKLTRDPLRTARSLANRDKHILAGGPPPSYRQNIFRIDNWTQLSRFQIFLHRWLETELRFHRFVSDHRIQRVHAIRTEDLGSGATLAGLFDAFGIAHAPIVALPATNINAAQHNPQTLVTDRDVAEFESMLAMMTPDLVQRIEYLRGYAPRAQMSQVGDAT